MQKVKPLTEELCIYGDLLTLLGTREDKDYLQKLDNLDQVEERGVGCGVTNWVAWGAWRSEVPEVSKHGGGVAISKVAEMSQLAGGVA
jgi:hypothetical protein